MRCYGTLQLDRENNVWLLDNVEPHVVIKLKALYKRIVSWGTSPFKFPNTLEMCNELEWFIQRYPLEASQEDLQTLQQRKYEHLKYIDDLEQILKPGYEARDFGLKLPLRDYQAQAVELFFKKKRLLIGDAVGLGKTLVGIATGTNQDCLPVLVVVQTHLPTQWREQIEKFTDAKIHLINGRTPYSLPPADFYVIKYSCLAAWAHTFHFLKMVKCIVFDELQELRVPTSEKYKGAEKIIETVDYAMGLTATPIFNFGDEIYYVLDLLMPGILGPKDEFIREWCSGNYDKKVNNPKALGTYLRENFLMIRRTREDVGKELPPINKIVHTVDYDEEAVKEIQNLAMQLAIKVTTAAKNIERGQAARELDIMLRQATGVSKAKYVAEYVKMLLANGEPVLLAGWHRAVYECWLKELKEFNPVMYTGSETPAEKDEAKRKFISGESNLMIISLRSGIGLDGLQHRGSIVVFGELDWSPAVHHQVEGRLARDGQEKQVTSIYLVSDSGSDPPMIDLLGLKSSQAQGIMNPFDALEAQTTNSDEGRIVTLAKAYLKQNQKGSG